MKFDMHCHTKEGSLDGKVSIEEYIDGLKRMGFDGMLICDHNTYKGYRSYVEMQKLKKRKNKDFVVLKGLEYDTMDAGHILVIMPHDVNMRLLELRGLPVEALIDIVHRYGGVLGPAHPNGEKYVSLFRTKKFQKALDKKRKQTASLDKIMGKFDFLEGFNSCESKERNDYAQELASRYHLPALGGSDAHKKECVGLGYTWFPGIIKSEEDMIACIRRERDGILCGGTVFAGTAREKMGTAKVFWVLGFRVYSVLAYLGRFFQRRKEVKRLQKY